MRRVRFALAAMLAIVALAAAACGSSDKGSSSSNAGATAGGGATSTAASSAPKVEFTGSIESGLPVGYGEVPKPDKKVTIGFASPLDANETVNYVGRAMKLETEKLGGSYVMVDAKGDPDKQVSAIEQLVAQKVDAIVVFPLDAKALNPALAQAKQAGIPVVGIEVNLAGTDPGSLYKTQVLQRRDEMSYLQVAEAAKLMPKGAKFGQIGFAVPVPTIEQEIERVKFWAAKFGLTPLGRVNNATDDIAGGEKAMTQLFGQYPDMQGMIAYNEESATGARAAARAQGKRDMPLIGNNGGSLGFESVRSGKIDATVQIQTPDTGAMAADGAILLAEGKKVPPTVMTEEPKLVDKDTINKVPTWDQVLQQRYGKTK